MLRVDLGHENGDDCQVGLKYVAELCQIQLKLLLLLVIQLYIGTGMVTIKLSEQ